MLICKVVQLSLQPHSRRLATLGLQTINFCLCLTVIGWRYYVQLFIILANIITIIIKISTSS